MNRQEKETIDEIFSNDGKKGVLLFLKDRYNLTDPADIEALYNEKMSGKKVKKASSAKLVDSKVVISNLKTTKGNGK